MTTEKRNLLRGLHFEISFNKKGKSHQNQQLLPLKTFMFRLIAGVFDNDFVCQRENTNVIICLFSTASSTY